MNSDATRRSRVSVVIPARNEEQYIQACITSVTNQDWSGAMLEAIVVDNASTDSTPDLVLALVGAGAIPITLVAEPEPGVGRAKNRGAAAARGDVLIFLDADSRMDPKLASDIARAHANGMLAGSIRVYADSENLIDRGFFALMEVGKVWFEVRGQMLYCDRDLFLAAGGFRPDLHLAEDLEFLRRLRTEMDRRGLPRIGHVRSSGIATSPRRLHSRPLRLGMLVMFARWALAFAGIGRTRAY
jgi:glycosyltransferase involved in cell wall biosynthesis